MVLDLGPPLTSPWILLWIGLSAFTWIFVLYLPSCPLAGNKRMTWVDCLEDDELDEELDCLGRPDLKELAA